MLSKLVGFIAALSLFILIFYSLASQTLMANTFPILGLVSINLLIVILSRLTKYRLLAEAEGGLKLFGETISKIVVALTLILVYLIGVGPVWLISRLTGKRFVDLNLNKTTNWVRKEKSSNLEEMF